MELISICSDIMPDKNVLEKGTQSNLLTNEYNDIPKLVYETMDAWEEDRIHFLKKLLKETASIRISKRIVSRYYYDTILKYLLELTHNKYTKWCSNTANNIAIGIDGTIIGCCVTEVTYACPEQVIKDIIDESIIWQFGGDDVLNENSYFKDIIHIGVL
jgi:hypothetical protein